MGADVADTPGLVPQGGPTPGVVPVPIPVPVPTLDPITDSALVLGPDSATVSFADSDTNIF